ncbi:unnamed protein product [Eruca vesicaria subsp. sativa]|uniref:CBS domain-containing protein n=1 Tax=Eruca vesicaria subsp. sativa TaxID=29727 RepID=A0ABC8LAN7_ERUVS|nr:unnamed protein product [Eruca vesicaria subsp. sativa]
MSSISLPITRLQLHTTLSPCLIPTSSSFSLPPPLSNRRRSTFSPFIIASAVFAAPSGVNNSVPAKNGGYTVGDFMTGRQYLHVVKPSTSVDDALELLVEKKVTGLPVIDDDWNLVGVVSDYDLLALDSISGRSQDDTNMFPNVDSSWKTFNELQKLISKTHGQVVGDLMTPSPLVVRGSTNLEDAARLLLETKFRRLPVVDSDGKLIGILTRGNVVRAALQIKRETENSI